MSTRQQQLREYIEDIFRGRNKTMAQIDVQHGDEFQHEWIVAVAGGCHDADSLTHSLMKICDTMFPDHRYTREHFGRVACLLHFARRLDMYLKEEHHFQWYTNETLLIDILSRILLDLDFQIPYRRCNYLASFCTLL